MGIGEVKARLHYQWVPAVLEYGKGEYVENDSVDAICSCLHYQAVQRFFTDKDG